MSVPTHPQPLDAGVARLVEQLDDNRRELFEERAAILEFDAGMTRLVAEQHALIQILARYGYPSAVPVRALAFVIAGTPAWALTTTAGHAHQRLAAMGATAIVEVDLEPVIRAQYRDLAFLAARP